MAEAAHHNNSNKENFITPLKPRKRRSVNPLDTPDGKKARVFTIPPSPFLERLGYGTGVCVFLMKQPDTPRGTVKSPWAVKKINSALNKSKSDLKTLEGRIKYEADMLRNISHKNIVGYRDTLRAADGSVALCMESGEKSLSDVIESRQEQDEGPFPPDTIHKVVFAVSQALDYLHNTMKLLHGDIKSHNILVKGDFEEIKLCDFGVCLRLKEDLQGLANERDEYMGTGPWACAEELITDKADIYSLGCVIYEMIALAIPHMPPMLDDSECSFDEEAFEEAQGGVPMLPDVHYDKSYHQYIALMTICCREDPTARPSAHEISNTLEMLTQQPVTTNPSPKQE